MGPCADTLYQLIERSGYEGRATLYETLSLSF